MSSPRQGQLPALTLADFGPGQEHRAKSFNQGKVFAILHKNDAARSVLPGLIPQDDYVYLFLHGGEDVSRFQNLMLNATHEIPADVVAQLLSKEYGSLVNSLKMRVCACYGNILRPGDQFTAAQRLAQHLPSTIFEAYHGVVNLYRNPPSVGLGPALRWDPLHGAQLIWPPTPGPWEPVNP
jgi:hypothetical protein